MKFSFLEQRFVSKAEQTLVNKEIKQWAIGGTLFLIGCIASIMLIASYAPK